MHNISQRNPEGKMNRRYCNCSIPEPNSDLVPKCNYCGYYLKCGKPAMDPRYFRRQIMGLILIMKDSPKDDAMVSREYIIEKLTMMLNGGIGFHPGITKHLDSMEVKKPKCGCCNGTGKIYSKLIRENVNCGGCGGSGVDE